MMLTAKFWVTLLKSSSVEATTAPFAFWRGESTPSRTEPSFLWQFLRQDPPKYLRSQPLGDFLKFAFFVEFEGAFLPLGRGDGDPGVKVGVGFHVFGGFFFELLFELLPLHGADVGFEGGHAVGQLDLFTGGVNGSSLFVQDQRRGLGLVLQLHFPAGETKIRGIKTWIRR